MDRLFWEMIGYNLITPAVPLVFMWRATSTAAAVSILPWWVVLILANTVGALGMLPIVIFFRRFGAERVDQWAQRWPVIGRLRRFFGRRMFLMQIMFNFTPLPDYVNCALAGTDRYSLGRFFVAQSIGRTAHNLPIVLGGAILVKQPWFATFRQVLEHPITTALGVLIIIGVAGVAVIRWYGNLVIGWMACEED